MGKTFKVSSLTSRRVCLETKIVDVYVLAGNRLAGELLVQVLDAEPDMEPVLCECVPGGDSKARVFVIDGASSVMPIGEGIRRLKHQAPTAKFIVVDRARSDDENAYLLKQGVHGFVEHSQVTRTLCKAVRAVLEGSLWVSQASLRAYVDATAQPKRHTVGNHFSITDREEQVLELVKRRLSNKEIANILGLQESTVKFHLSNLFGKLGISSRHDLTPMRGLLSARNTQQASTPARLQHNPPPSIRKGRTTDLQ